MDLLDLQNKNGCCFFKYQSSKLLDHINQALNISDQPVYRGLKDFYARFHGKTVGGSYIFGALVISNKQLKQNPSLTILKGTKISLCQLVSTDIAHSLEKEIGEMKIPPPIFQNREAETNPFYLDYFTALDEDPNHSKFLSTIISEIRKLLKKLDLKKSPSSLIGIQNALLLFKPTNHQEKIIYEVVMGSLGYMINVIKNLRSQPRQKKLAMAESKEMAGWLSDISERASEEIREISIAPS